MEVAIVTPYLNQTGGREKVVLSIIQGVLQQASDIRLHVFVGKVEDTIINTLGEKVAFHKLPIIAGSPFLEAVSFFLTSWLFLRQTHFDCYHFHWPYLTSPGPSIYTAHSVHRKAIWELEKSKGLIGRLRFFLRQVYPIPTVLEWITLRLFTLTKCVVAVSPKVAKELAEVYGVSEESIIVVPNPIDLSQARLENRQLIRAKVRAEIGIGAGDLIIGTVANRLTGKNVDLILKSLARIPDSNIKFLLIGNLRQKDKRRFSKWIQTLKLEDRVYITKASDDIGRFYLAMDIFVFPSSYDSFGLAFFEALSAGLPCIVSESTGALAFIPDDLLGDIVFKLSKLEEHLLQEIILDVCSRLPMHRFPTDKVIQLMERINTDAIKGYINLYKRHNRVKGGIL